MKASRIRRPMPDTGRSGQIGPKSQSLRLHSLQADGCKTVAACACAAVVSRAFETCRRRQLLSFSQRCENAPQFSGPTAIVVSRAFETFRRQNVPLLAQILNLNREKWQIGLLALVNQLRYWQIQKNAPNQLPHRQNSNLRIPIAQNWTRASPSRSAPRCCAVRRPRTDPSRRLEITHA